MKHRESLNDSDDDDGPQDEDAWLFEDLGILAKLYSRLRDKEQLIELIFEVCCIRRVAIIFALTLVSKGNHGRFIKGHHYYILLPARSSIQSR
jgi:hypothetical protein